MFRQTGRKSLLALVIAAASATPGLAAPTDCELVMPPTIDNGMLQQFSLRCDAPFIGFLQVALDGSFNPSFNFPIRASQQVGSDHFITVSLRVPWDVQSLGASEFWFAGYALDGSGNTHFDAQPVPVGQGNRVYLNAAPDAGKNLFVMEMEFEQNTENWDELTTEADYTGTSYYYWSGSDHFTNNTRGRIEYLFKVETAGQYALAFRSGHFGGHENNDCWCRWDDGEFEKILCGQDGFWRWQTTDEHGGGFKANLDVGVHKFTFAARSNEFSLDRFHLFHTGDYSRGSIEDENFTASAHEYE